MSFLGDLATQLNGALNVGENTTHTLDTVVDGQNIAYGSLGDFASQFDQSAQRKYVEEGYLRVDPFETDPKQFEILMQQPNATIFVKKKMFSSVSENFRPDFMDQDEKLYYRAMKILFQNKCQQISALEILSKIQQISSTTGSVSDQLIPLIITLSDSLSGTGSNVDISSLNSVTDKLRRIYGFNTTNASTTWLTDTSDLFQSQFGQGTGVIEITNFTNLNTTTTVNGIKNPGSFNFSISDPYESMRITEWDIENAIAMAVNMWYSNSTFQFAQESAQQVINDQQSSLDNIRSARGASPISFNVNPNTLLGQRVTAILDRIGTELVFSYNGGFGGIGSSVSVSAEYLRGGAIAGEDGLDSSTSNFGLGPEANIRSLIPQSELSVFSALVTAIYNNIQLQANSQSSFQTSNQFTNYARRKLRFNFNGKLIIQPNDVVHIYMSSQSNWDSDILGGLQTMFSGLGFLQNVNNAVSNLTNAVSTLMNPSGNISFQVEKTAYVGADFPNYLWSILRTQFVTENEGSHVFAGLVDRAIDNWSNGKYTIEVNGRDNIAYFEKGKVNFKPGVDNFNGVIFDPLTPFQTSFDSVTPSNTSTFPPMLNENITILGTSQDQTSMLKFKSGPMAGQKVTSDNYIQENIVDSTTTQISATCYIPDGLVYKWKEGIGVFTQFGNSTDLYNSSRVGSPSLYQNPFAGQDIMNVISLLITGQPYNFATYWQATQNVDGFGGNPQTGQDAAYSYIASLRKGLSTNNVLWGNFIPFKNLVVDEQSFILAQNTQLRITQQNSDLNSKLQQLSSLTQRMTLFSAGTALLSQSPALASNPAAAQIQAQITNLTTDIQNTIKSVQINDASFSALSAQAGADPSYSSNPFSSTVNPAQPNTRQQLRREINYLTRRMSYNVRANEDKNYFIVDDSYDKDYDIIAYNQALASGIPLYNNEFTSVKQNIADAADLLNMEVFADSQGHVRARFPQYNRMPSSVFYRMIYLKQAYGIQIFPEFLTDLFGNQIDTLRKSIEVVEDMIRLDCAVLGYNDDQSAAGFIQSNGSTNNSAAPFSFLSDSTDTITDINQLLASTNVLQNSQLQTFTTTLQQQAQATNIGLTNSQRYTIILQNLQAQNQNADGFSIQNITQFNNNSYIDTLVTRIQTKSGQSINKLDYLTQDAATNTYGLNVPITQTVDVFKVTGDLQSKIQQHQQSVQLFYTTVKNAIEFNELNTNTNQIANQMLAPAVYGNSNVPEVFENMIEDETYDDYGLNAGQRYIIKRAQVRNISISENPPDYTMVQINGVLNPFAPNSNPTSLNAGFANNGNGLTTAVAVDYDTWRNYGFTNQSAVTIPFFSDPDVQCGPYASMILSRARKNILKGTVTISGNEFMQPGEVVYLEDRSMLFYVESVRHSLTFSSGFTTTLELTYGHSPGEYIPSVLDMIGKMIYNVKDNGTVNIQRQGSSANEYNLGVLLMDPNNSTAAVLPNSDDSDSVLPSNSYSSFNNDIINNILYAAANIINSNNAGTNNNVIADIELRLYSDNNTSASSDLQNFAAQAGSILAGAAQGPSQSNNSGPSAVPTIPANSISVVFVNIDDTTDRRSPSQKAMDSARNQVATNSVSSIIPPFSASSPPPSFSNTQLRAALFNYVVDCWITFSQTNTTGNY